MQTERPTETFQTVGGHTVVVKTYTTGREFKDIKAKITEGASVRVVNGIPTVSDIPANAEERSKEKAIELIVVSLDGSTENIAARVDDLPKDDYQEIEARVAIISGLAKKTEAAA